MCFGLLMNLASQAEQSNSSQINLNETVTTGDVPGGQVCTREDLEFATSQSAARAVKDRGYSPISTLNCRSVHLAIFPEANIVQLVGWQHTDVLVGITLLRPDPASPIAVMMFLGGMVQPFHSEQNNGNLAAFNSLLRNYHPLNLALDLVDIGKLYLFSTGHGYAPKSEKLGNLLAVNDIDSMVGDVHGKQIVRLHRVPGRAFGPPAANWILTFDTTHAKVHLLSAKLDPS